MSDTALHYCDHAYFTYDEEQALLKFCWKDHFISQQEFKDLVSLFATIAEKKRPKALFVDAVHSRITITSDLQKWHDEEIIPRYHKAGVGRMGFLIPQNIFSEVSHKRTFAADQAKTLLPTRFFGSQTDAMNWLLAN